jgi:hypothetical protein
MNPIEGNPWPHEMTITIDDSPHAVMELLWVREAFALKPDGDVPPLLVNTPPRSAAPHDAQKWEDAWPEIWNGVIDHAAEVTDHSLIEQLQSAALGATERAELLNRLFGPTWRDRFGASVFDDSYQAWTERQFTERTHRHPRSLDESPERVSLQALIPAWEAGLTKIITIPCHGEHTRVIGDSALLMTEATRNRPELYAAALGNFREPQN